MHTPPIPASEVHRGELLLDDELQELTGRKQPAAQVRALTRMGIPARLANGKAIASRHHLRRWLEGGQVAGQEPDWRAVL